MCDSNRGGRSINGSFLCRILLRAHCGLFVVGIGLSTAQAVDWQDPTVVGINKCQAV